MYKIAICDDEELYRKKLIRYLLQEERLKDKAQFFEYTDGKELLEQVGCCHDLIFLDIQMKETDGNQAARILRNSNQNAILVFCTNYYRLTPETLKVHPFRYIMKDFDDRTLKKELPVIIEEMLQKVHPPTLAVAGDGELHLVEVPDILYIVIQKRGTRVFFHAGGSVCSIPCKESLREMYAMTRKWGFEYAHNSYIVNFANIMQLRKNILELRGDIQLNISRSKKQQFDEHFTEYLQVRYKRK